MFCGCIILSLMLFQCGSSTRVTRTESLQKEIEITEHALYNAEAKHHQLKKELKVLSQKMKDIVEKKDEDNWVAFTVCMTNDKTHEADETIIFDKVVLNGGNHYDNVTGLFSCPFDGHFNFNLQVRSIEEDIQAQIMLDDTVLVTTVAPGGSDPYNRQGSVKVNVFCTAGQTVYARNTLSNVDIRGTENCGTNFSGKLLNLP